MGEPLFDPLDWRIQMLAYASGFSHRICSDDFGVAYGGPALNGKTVSIRSQGPVHFVMRVPSLVALEMRKDATAGASFTVDANGLITFIDNGPNVDAALKRAAALMRALPDTPLAIFKEQTQGMPSSTEVERLARQRVGQHIFRKSLEDYWGSKCAVTGIADRALLRASHTKRWADCESDVERLDVHNGFLLAAHVDAAFDAALLTFDQEGAMMLSSRLSESATALLSSDATEVRLTVGHQIYLEHHRARFRLLA